MKRTVVLTDVPASRVDQVVSDYESEGAAVTKKSNRKGYYTVTAELQKTPAKSAALFPGSVGTSQMQLAPGEMDRPSRSELEAAQQGAQTLYYPEAKRDVMGQMKTVGRYEKGYPVGAIVHYTAGQSNPLGDIKHALDNGYCYFVIAPNGEVYQNFPLDRWGSHAGKSYHPKLGAGVSQYLVGIEICCAGKVEKLDNGKFRPWYNEAKHLRKYGREPDPAADLDPSLVRTVSEEGNRVAGHYHKYTMMQEASLRTLLSWLHSNNPAVFKFDLVLGHDEVSAPRKVDPGGSLSTTMAAFRNSL